MSNEEQIATSALPFGGQSPFYPQYGGGFYNPGQQFPVPFQQQGFQGFGPAAAAAKPGGSSPLAALGDIKGIVDRLGGIDGIVSTVTKVQKMIQSLQQIAPLAKLLMGSFLSPKAKTTDNDDGDEDTSLDHIVPKLRKRRKVKKRSSRAIVRKNVKTRTRTRRKRKA